MNLRHFLTWLRPGTGILFLPIVLGLGVYIKQQQEGNLSSLDTGIGNLQSQINQLPSATGTSKVTITQKIATLEKQINSLPETLPTKKELNQQLSGLQQEIDSLPDNSIPPKDRLSLEKDRLSLAKDLATARNAIWGTLFQAASAIFFVFTAFFTWRNIKIAEEKQITERFSKAVELLGSDKIDVRLGGIYALERIAKDSPKDHWTIMEVLTSFIREKSPLQSQQKPQNKPLMAEFINQTSQDNSLPKITTDVQAALTVIGRRNFQEDKGRINLSSTNLSQANLNQAHLERAILSKAKANLKEAYLNEANLEGADLWEANLKGAKLSKANLEGANLKGAKLSKVNLEGAYLNEANLEGAFLWEANLKGTDLWKANLKGAKLSEAHLEGAKLDEANLERVDLWKAHLEGANLSKANLKEAKLSEAHLEGVKNLNVKQVQLASNWEMADYDGVFRLQLGLPLNKSNQP